MWQEPRTTRDCISVAIILPSGVGPGNFKVQVAEAGDCIDLTVTWPDVLTDARLLHKKWLVTDEISDVHPKILGFEASLKRMRKSCDDNVFSKARIGLPITVESHIEKFNIGWRDNDTRVLYLDLKALAEDYGTQNDTTTLEIV